MGYSCKLLISNKQVDSRLIKKYTDFDYDSIPGSGLSWSPVRFAKFALNLANGILKCVGMIRREKPDVLIGFGGFLSMPALCAGYLCRIPVAIHEANRVPGRVTRVVSRFATRVYLPKGIGMITGHPKRIRNLGMPVRGEIRKLDKMSSKRTLGLDERLRTLLVFGGSQGAQALNEWVREHQTNLGESGIQVFCLTGAREEGDQEEEVVLLDGTRFQTLYRMFSDDMATVLSAADLVVSRAGAGSISEIAKCEVPAILIPYPYAADNHQQNNAKYFVECGGGLAIDEDDIGLLYDLVVETFSSQTQMELYRECLSVMAEERPQAQIASDLELLIETRRR